MTRLISKKQAVVLRAKRKKSDIALATLYALRARGQIGKDDFDNMIFAIRGGRLFYNKKIKSLIK